MFRFLSAALLFAFLWVSTASPAEDIGAYLTQDGKFKHGLELRTAQEGFAGVTGTVWACDEDGKWTISKFVNDKRSPPERKGRLNPTEMRRLAAALASGHFVDLPTEFGRDLKVNRKLISVTFGKKTATCVLNADETMEKAKPPKNDPKAATWSRFIGIEQAIQRQMDSKPAPLPAK